MVSGTPRILVSGVPVDGLTGSQDFGIRDPRFFHTGFPSVSLRSCPNVDLMGPPSVGFRDTRKFVSEVP